MQIAGDFNLDGRRVVLIDTPGFDDTTQSDTDVLKMIAAFLETSYVHLRLDSDPFSPHETCPVSRYKRGGTLARVLYFHRISDFRMTDVSGKNPSMFRKVCGDGALRNVIIVTNMWGEVDPQTGNAREAE